MQEFLFSYGSLINRNSRPDYLSLVEYPVTLQGWKRSWDSRHFEEHLTYLGVRAHAGSTCNGVLLQVDSSTLRRLQSRERFYSLQEVSRSAIQISSSCLPSDSRIWIWQSNDVDYADENYPISQSYIDTCLQGCLQLCGLDWCREFIASTYGWSEAIVADRDAPIYPRASAIGASVLSTIDELLSEFGIAAR